MEEKRTMWSVRFWGDRGALSSWWCLRSVSLLCSFQPFIKSSLSYHFKDYLWNLKALHFLRLCCSPLLVPVQNKCKVWIRDHGLYWIQFTNFITFQIYYSHANISWCFFAVPLMMKRYPILYGFYCQRVSLQF